MHKKLLFLECLSFCFIIGCTSIIKKEDIFVQGQQIKAQQVIVPEISAAALPDPVKIFLPKYSPLPEQEKLIYKAKYLGITIGQFIIVDRGKTMLNDREAYCFELIVDTLPFFSTIFKTKDRYVSYMDTQRLVVLRHEEYIKGGEVLESTVDFNYETHTALYKNVIDHRESKVTIPNQVYDILSGGYYLRMIAWELGDTTEINIYADEKIYDFVGLLHSKTKIDLPNAEDQAAYLLKPYLFHDGKQVRDISAEVHFATSTTRKPLRAVLKTILGSVSVNLQNE